jgi:hypothetical protein
MLKLAVPAVTTMLEKVKEESIDCRHTVKVQQLICYGTQSERFIVQNFET